MNIQDALKETGKAKLPNGKDGAWYALNGNGYLCVYLYGEYAWTPRTETVVRTDFEPYHPKEEIRPKEAGELWIDDEGLLLFTYRYKDDGLKCKEANGEWGYVNYVGYGRIIHNQNGWTRLYPPVEAD